MTEETDKRDELATYLREAWWNRGARGPCNGEIERAIADAILADPAALFDAVVAAGGAEGFEYCVVNARAVGAEYRPNAGMCSYEGQHVTAYRPIAPKPPHVCEWRVTGWKWPSELSVICDCGEERLVPNRLPIEVDA